MNPFDALRHVDAPATPDRRFASSLKTRIAAALAPTVQLPERNPIMTDSNAPARPPDARGLHPYIAVAGAAAAIEWYTSVFGAVETIRYTGDDGRVGHAELEIGDGKIMISDEYPDFGAVSPHTLGGTPVKLYVEVGDVDSVWEHALDAGADGQRPPEDQAYGRRACAFGDPFGHQWMVQTVTGAPDTDEIEAGLGGDFTITEPAATADTGGDAPIEIGYVTMSFDDTERARTFYRALFGWRTDDGHAGPGYAHIANTRLPMGMTPDGSDRPAQLYFRVADAGRAAAQAVELGGSIVERADHDSGTSIDCLDDQGRPFILWQPAAGY